MIEKILNYEKYDISKLEKEIIDLKDARLLFIYLFVTKNNKEIIANKIFETKDFKYMHFLLRNFYVKIYDKILDYILKNNSDASYLYNILYDVDYLNNIWRIKIINKIISLNNDPYAVKALYYYFCVLKLYDAILFKKIQLLVKEKLGINVNKENYTLIFEKILFEKKKDPNGYSENCYIGHKNYIPNIIVCHINSTYNSAISHFYDSKSEVSSHYVIRKDGHIKQVVSLENSAWANGTSFRESSDAYYKFATSELINSVSENANYFTFSIEHESFDGSLTNEQIESSVKVIKEIIKYVKIKYNYDIPIDRKHIIGHNEVNPIVRKKCPGINFPYDEIIKRLKNKN